MTHYERIKAYLFRTHGREPDIRAFLRDDPDWYEALHDHGRGTMKG